MLVGSQTAGKNYFFTGLYYLKEGQPPLLAEGYVAGHGGARSSMKFFKTGEVLALTWSSGTGEGEGTLYKLEGSKGATKVVALLAVHRVKVRKKPRKRLLPKQKKPGLGQLINPLP